MKVLRIEHPESGKGCYTHFNGHIVNESEELRDMINEHSYHDNKRKHLNPFEKVG